MSQLSGTSALSDVEVEATNWMGALKAARLRLGEEGAVPSGASCAVAPDGTVTVLDAGSRRRFTLKPADDGPPPAPRSAPAQASPPAAPQPQPAMGRGTKDKPLARTVAMIPEGRPARAEVVIPVKGEPTPAMSAHAQGPSSAVPPTSSQTARTSSKKRKFETIAFNRNEGAAAARQIVISDRPPPKPEADVAPLAPASPGASLNGLRLLLERDEDPTPDNPLTYRERVYVVPARTPAVEAEAALRLRLEAITVQLADTPKGKFVNLAAFDHVWQDEPARPPLVVLSWKDWRGEPEVEYPAAELSRQPLRTGAAGQGAERLAVAFETLQALSQIGSPSGALQLVVELMERTLPSEIINACLYDIDTDELRFVATSGAGAEDQRGTAVPSDAGLLGQAMRREADPLVIGTVLAEPAFNAQTDCRAGVQAHNMLLRAVLADGRPLGLLQLVNRRDADGFSRDDVNVLNYIADRLAECLLRLRLQPSPG